MAIPAVQQGKTGMTRFAVLLLAASAAFPGIAHAQDDSDRGIYAVARAGMSIEPQLKLDESDQPAGSTFDDKTKFKSGFNGEIGGGYDFGIFRIEQTLGYSSSGVKTDDLVGDGLAGDGRLRSFNMNLSGYVDLPVSRMFVPYLGGGVGVSRVEARLSRTAADGGSSSFDGKDWGMTWHLDAGVGVRVAPKTTVEIGGRYAQTQSLKFVGEVDGAAATFEPTQRALTGTIGIRQRF